MCDFLLSINIFDKYTIIFLYELLLYNWEKKYKNIFYINKNSYRSVFDKINTYY